MALPTHLEAFTGTLAACADKGRWQQCLPIAAALVSGDADADAGADAAASISPLPEMAEMTSRFPEMTSRFPEMLSRLSARDRAVYALDLPRYEAQLYAENKVAWASASWLSGGFSQRLSMPQAVPSFGQPRPHRRLSHAGRPHRPARGASAPLDPLEVTQNPLALGCARQATSTIVVGITPRAFCLAVSLATAGPVYRLDVTNPSFVTHSLRVTAE
eukprot:scaffold9029_cov69-Phaeocystis_antarctica.AAC.1